jgi:hypothetical protein
MSVFSLRRAAELLVATEETESGAGAEWVLRAEKLKAETCSIGVMLEARLQAVQGAKGDTSSVTDPSDVDMYRDRIEELEAELQDIKRQRMH